ncbi:MAG: NlpC/P60 family protein [Phascolarctobacterium sp.]|uniref:C40 family peptidase n=1 Tax=Phascolarctobacterium sp. TaxID=2049039 RepID=UPI0026DB383C|nr:NlpC/P60 family protein [Phascolarctobacterium sp.]MDO4920393.1 NlpC/P60 family protein [Phascolarctobacterium sp.]
MGKRLTALLTLLALICWLPLSAEAKKKTAKQTPAVKSSAQQSDWRVKVAQQKLQALGLSEEKPSGRMTDATKTALKKFQQQHKLKASGALDDKTYRKLTWEAFAKEGITNVKGSEIVKQAAKYKGVPYKFGGVTAKGFDCSGYVQYVFKNCRAGLPRAADEQVLQGVFVTQKQLRPGDLVFFTTYAAGASHVGIYAGKNQFWSATSSKGVMLCSLQDSYWKTRYYGARRVLVSNGEV